MIRGLFGPVFSLEKWKTEKLGRESDHPTGDWGGVLCLQVIFVGKKEKSYGDDRAEIDGNRLGKKNRRKYLLLLLFLFFFFLPASIYRVEGKQFPFFTYEWRKWFGGHYYLHLLSFSSQYSCFMARYSTRYNQDSKFLFFFASDGYCRPK